MKNTIIPLLALTLVACNSSQAPRAVYDHKTITIALGNSEIETAYSASVRAEQFVNILPQVTGTITEILVDEGAKVKKGQTLFIIDQVPYTAALGVAKASVKAAEAAVSTAELNVRNARELHREAIISQNELEITENALLEASAALALAEADAVSAENNLSYTVIKSPVTGVAGMMPYRVGELVSSSISSPLVSVATMDRMQCYFSLSEKQAQTLQQQVGQDITFGFGEVEFQLNNGTRYAQTGKIDAVSGIVDSSTGAVAMRAVFDNPEGLLKDGGSGSIIIQDRMEGVVVVPLTATFEIQDKVLAYRVVDGKAVSVQLTVYPYNNGREYVVLDGLEVGDIIIAEGAGLIREGQQVVSDKSKKE